MNKHLFFSLLAMLFCGLATAQAPQLAWVRPIFGTSPTAPLASLITDMCTDRDGNTYITGEFQTQLKFGNVILNGNNDDKTLFLAKYNNAGTPVWAKKAAPQTPLVSSPFAGSAKIAVDSTGNIYWCGNYIAGALDFGGGVSVTRACTNDCREGFLVKMNGNGDIQFTKSLHASVGNPFNVADVTVDAQGRHYIAGSFTGTEVWLQGGANIGGITKDGFYLVQYNPAGNAEWIAFLPDNSGTPTATSVAISPDGQRIAVTGTYTDQTINFGNSAVTSSTSPSKHFAVWYNTMGQPMGAGTLGATSMDVLDIRMDQQYRIWAACDYTGNLTWNDNTVTSPPSANKGAVVAIVSTANPAIAAGNTGYNNFSSPITSIALGADNKFYTGGFGKETLTVAGNSFTNNGCTDIILSGGAGTTVNWGKAIGGSGCEEIGNFTFGSLMDVDKVGNLYISGIFENGATAGGVTVDGNGLWIGKLSTSTVATQEASPEPVTIAPNPANAFVQIETAAYLDGLLQMLDINGRTTIKQSIDNDITTLQVSDIPAGIYFIALEKPGLARQVIKMGIAH